MGMSRGDFCASTIEEFEAVCKAWTEQRDSQWRDAWERMRMEAFITIQPHIKPGSRLTPARLLPLPWDKDTRRREGVAPETPEQRRKHFEELTAKMGDTY